MDKLSEKMKERLEKWRKNPQPVPSVSKLRAEKNVRRLGKGDHGDALSEEDWGEECRRSQTRK